MFIIDVEYTVDLSQIDAVLAEHRAWLDIYFQNGRVHLSSSTLQGIIRNKKFHDTSICHYTGSGQNFPRHKPWAALHRRHRRSEATLDIRTFDPSQLWPEEACRSQENYTQFDSIYENLERIVET